MKKKDSQTRFGMTLIELLVTLGLLSLVLVGVTSWLEVTASTISSSDRLHLRQCIEAVWQRIEDDLASGDFLYAEDDADPHAQADGDSLRIRTRGRDGDMRGKTITSEYGLDRTTDVLVRVEVDEQGRRQERLLVGQIAQAAFVQHTEREHLTLVVTFATNDGETFEKEFNLR